jgi:hypothetical protein
MADPPSSHRGCAMITVRLHIWNMVMSRERSSTPRRSDWLTEWPSVIEWLGPFSLYTLKTEAACFSETSVYNQKAARRNIPEDNNLNFHSGVKFGVIFSEFIFNRDFNGVVEWLAPLFRIRMVPVSNLVPETDHPDWVFRDFPIPPRKCREIKLN